MKAQIIAKNTGITFIADTPEEEVELAQLKTNVETGGRRVLSHIGTSGLKVKNGLLALSIIFFNGD